MFSALTMLALTGCAVGPNFAPPAAPTPDRYTAAPLPATTQATNVAGGEAQSFQFGQDVVGRWWTLFGSPKLDRLVDEAVASYPTLAAQQAALKQAQAQARAESGVFFPQVTGAASDTQSHALGVTERLSSASVNVSYVFDVFGGERRQLEALEAGVDFQKFEYEASYLTLTSSVVAAAVEIASLEGQLSATREILSEEEQQLSFIQRKLDVGNETLADVLQQRSAVASVRATLPALEQQLAVARDELAVLTGRPPGAVAEVDIQLSDLTLPRDLPVSLPSKLVEQRPDIRAQEAVMHEASAEIGVATAAMLPQFTLTGGYGGEWARIADLLEKGPNAWSLTAGITTPIFEGGTLRAERDAKVDAFESAAAQYRQTVLNAFQNVADALNALDDDAQALNARQESLAAGQAGLDLVQKQYDGGAVDYVTLLTAQQQYQQARLSYVQALASRFADTTVLFQALGGGWWNRQDLGAATPAPQGAR